MYTKMVPFDTMRQNYLKMVAFYSVTVKVSLIVEFHFNRAYRSACGMYTKMVPFDTMRQNYLKMVAFYSVTVKVSLIVEFHFN